MFGLKKEEAEAVQTDPVLAVQTLVIRQLNGLAAAGKRIVLLVDALDEAQDRGTNRVVRLLKDLGKAKTNALSLIVTTRPEPRANLEILKSAYGSANVLNVAPLELRSFSSTGTTTSLKGYRLATSEWAAKIQANEHSKIFVAVCSGFVAVWLARRPAIAIPAPPSTIDAAYL